MKVVVIGGSGMLGSMVVDVLSGEKDLEVHASYKTNRPKGGPENVRWFEFHEEADFAPVLDSGDWIVNAAGLIRQKIAPGWRSIREATKANVLLPCRLSGIAESTGTKVLQIATDCVFEGTIPASETQRHAPEDLYGKTKSLGEVEAPWYHHLRCSIVGPEPGRGSASLLGWLLGQSAGAVVKGYADHLWNGVTTLAFARVVAAVVRGDVDPPPGVRHLVPFGHATKHDLLCEFARAYGRDDLRIEPVVTKKRKDMRLVTNGPSYNRTLWKAAGYDDVPTISSLVRELAAWDYSFAREGVVS